MARLDTLSLNYQKEWSESKRENQTNEKKSQEIIEKKNKIKIETKA